MVKRRALGDMQRAVEGLGVTKRQTAPLSCPKRPKEGPGKDKAIREASRRQEGKRNPLGNRTENLKV